MSGIWTRNYDNLFSAVYGRNSYTPSGSLPNYSEPICRNTSGSYFGVRTTGINGAITAGELGIPFQDTWLYNQSTCGYSTQTYSPRYPEHLNCGIVLGGGDDEPSIEDYQVKIPFTSSMTVGTVTRTNVEFDETNHTYTKTVKIPIAYSGSAEITVKEFGIFVYPCTGGDAYSGFSGTATMVYHEVLDEPITLQQNDTIEITFTQTVTQPNYTPYPVNS